MARQWSANDLTELMLIVDYALNHYVSWCYEAEAVAPAAWRKFWQDEARSASATRRSLLHRMQTFVDYAAGRPVETLGQKEVRRGR